MEKIEEIKEFCKKEKIFVIEEAGDYVFSTDYISIMLDKKLGEERTVQIIKNVWRCL
jgi:hypothetical protein